MIGKMKYFFDGWLIGRQSVDAAMIYDSIFQKKTKSEVMNQVKRKLSKEIVNILNRVEEVGYFGSKIPALTNGHPTISIVVPHFNQTVYLEEALLYLSKQTSLPEEVIVVDDLSDDWQKVQEICNKFIGHINIKLVRANKKLYAGGAKQLGAELATSDIVAMHDADDVSHADRIKITRNFFANHPDALQLGVGFVRFKNNFFDFLGSFGDLDLNNFIIFTETLAGRMRERFIKQEFSKPDHGGRVGWFGVDANYTSMQCGHVAYRKEVAKFLKWSSPFNYVFSKFEDYDFNFMLLLLGQAAFQIDLPLVYYRGGTSTNIVDY